MNQPAGPLIPDYAGGSLNNLAAEVEQRLAGWSPAPGLHARIARRIPPADTYVVLLIDGLGARQLVHPSARPLVVAQRATIHAPFPTTTTVGLASFATGLPPSWHGLLGHFVMLPGYPRPVNSLRWVDSASASVDPSPGFLPDPNLWERLRMGGVEPITVQPAAFADSGATAVIYRGCRFEGVATTDELVRAVLDLARVPGRLIFAYYPNVDVAAHMEGPASPEYARALAGISTAWDRIAARLPRRVTLIGTADHGVVPISGRGKHRVASKRTPGLTFFGDPRCLYVKGPIEKVEALSARLPATWCPRPVLRRWWGPPPEPGSVSQPAASIEPDGAFLADPGRVLLPGHMDSRLVGYHGGLDPGEVEIPVLVGVSPG